MIFAIFHQRRSLFEGIANVDTSVAMRSKLLFQLGEELINRNFFGGQKFEEHQAGEDAVALRNVPRKTDSAALLGAEKHVAFYHFRADVFEAHAGFDEGQTISLAHLINHGGRGERFDNSPVQMPVYVEMLEQHAND